MGGESIYYGLNALSNNLIMADRKKLKNPNGLILGTPGSGKSFAAKREIANAFIVTRDDIIVCDPEGEYYPLVRAFHGQVIRISPTSHDYINPMDINLDYADDDDPLSLKSDFILSLCELIVGGKNGLEPVEMTIIDRCVRLVYQDYLSDPVPENMPILEDLYNLLREQKEQEAQRLATSLEIYVNGSLKVFNHRTNVELNNRMVCFDIKDLGKQLKKLGMLIVQDQVWNRVTINRSAKKGNTFYMVIDRSSTSENVYMMSLVDENDLAEFLDETEDSKTEKEQKVVIPETTTETTPAVEKETEETTQKNTGGADIWKLCTIVLAGGLGIGAVVVYLKYGRKKEDGFVSEQLEFTDGPFINEEQENEDGQED